ncbi:Origin recognition complex subunit 6 [Lachancea thermotolerans]
MSTQQVRRCVCDILSIEFDDPKNDWSQGRLKKLQTTTSTLYNVSLSKVMLKQHEETARGHLCAFIAAEKLSEKYEPDLRYRRDKIPLEPRQATKLLDILKNSILTSSPVKSIGWSPSPVKQRSPVKNGGRFTAMDPKEMRKQLFGTPTKANLPPKALENQQTASPEPTTEDEANKIRTTRRKLTFEVEDAEDERDLTLASRKVNSASSGEGEVREGTRYAEVENSSMPVTPRKRSASASAKTPSPKKRRIPDRGDAPNSARACLLYKKYYKMTAAEIVELCNHFEIPSDLAYRILDQFFEHATYLVFPFQLVCGLILNCCQVIFNEKRRKDPRVNEYLYQKMSLLMKTNDVTEIKESMRIVRELIDGEKWYRNLKVQYDYFDGVVYEEAIAIRLGNMLQRATNIATDEQFEIWKHNIITDISLRDG